MEQPVCLIHSSIAEKAHPFVSDLFEVHVVDTAEEAWNIAELKRIDLFVTDQRHMSENTRGLLTGIKVLHPNLILLHLVRTLDARELMDLINISSRMRIVEWSGFEEGMKNAAADAFGLLMASQRKDQRIAQLEAQNEQFEFMLRQSMLFE